MCAESKSRHSFDDGRRNKGGTATRIGESHVAGRGERRKPQIFQGVAALRPPEHFWNRKLMKIGLEDGAKAAILTIFDL
jgi:hypothetical protein